MPDDIPIPFVDKSLDPGDPAGSGVVIVLLIAGFAVFAMAQGIGSYLASRANSTLGNVLGFNPATGEDQSGVPGV